MKTKLQALIAEQKALTAKFEEWLNLTTEESSTLDPKKVYIKGHPTRGAEVIKMLEDLGGVNRFNWDGTRSWIIYRIRHEDNVILSTAIADLKYTPCNIELHLPEEVSEVDPPKEEVELIEGEVYQNDEGVFTYKNIDKETTAIDAYAYFDKQSGRLEYDTYACTKDEVCVATPEQRKQLFDALDKAGKHFDKEKMQLLDVEEWSKTHRDYPIICRLDNNSSWSVKLMCDYVNGKALVRTKSTQKQWMPQVIPYNDQTKHLVGTTDSPDKHYKFVEK